MDIANNENSLLKYYLMKRVFLFFDEWMFYGVLIYLVHNEYYIITPFVLTYGISCIYTSYTNIEKIEEKITGIKQIIWLTNKPLFEYVYDSTKTFFSYMYRLKNLIF